MNPTPRPVSAKGVKPAPGKPLHRPIPRTVDACEKYLDRLALVLERAGSNAGTFLPLARRLALELEEAKAEESLLSSLLQRRRRYDGDGSGAVAR